VFSWEIEPRENVKIFCGIPVTPSFQYLHLAVIESWDRAWKPLGTIRVFERSHGVGTAREKLVEKFLATNCTHFLLLDSDIIIHGDTIQRMLQVNKPVVLGKYHETSNQRLAEVFHHCFTSNTPITFRNKHNEIVHSTFSMFNRYRTDDIVKIFHNGSEYNARLIKEPLSKTESLVDIQLKNGFRITTTMDHPNYTNDGIVLSKDLTNDDFLIVETNPISSGNWGTYDWGFVVGLFLAEGSAEQYKAGLELKLNEEDKNLLKKLQNLIKTIGVNARYREDNDSCYLASNTLFSNYISTFVGGDRANNKYLKHPVWSTSREFRMGLYDGEKFGDGAKRSGEIFTTSDTLKDDLTYLMISLGKLPHIGYSERNELWSLREYSLSKYSSAKKYIKKYDDFKYGVRVDKIKIRKPRYFETYVYDFEVDSNDHLFRLGNGIVTHNSQVPFRRDPPIDFKLHEIFDFPKEDEDVVLAGLGLMLVKREVFEQLDKPYFLYSSEYGHLDDYHQISEDFWFLLRIQDKYRETLKDVRDPKSGDPMFRITYVPDIWVWHHGTSMVGDGGQIAFL